MMNHGLSPLSDRQAARAGGGERDGIRRAGTAWASTRGNSRSGRSVVRLRAVGAHQRVTCIFAHVCKRRAQWTMRTADLAVELGAHTECGERGM